MTKKSRIYILVSVAAFLFAVLLLVVLSKKKTAGHDTETFNKTTEGGSAIAEFIRVKLFFYSEISSRLQPVYREIEVPQVREDLYRKFIALLLAGANGHITPVPEGLQLRSVFYLVKKEMLVLDFNDALINNFPGGTAAELEFIYFIVDNCCYNFKEIKKVMFLSGGNENKTLAGHIDLEKPFYPDFSWLQNE